MNSYVDFSLIPTIHLFLVIHDTMFVFFLKKALFLDCTAALDVDLVSDLSYVLLVVHLKYEFYCYCYS